jgi:hypothetical protein
MFITNKITLKAASVEIHRYSVSVEIHRYSRVSKGKGGVLRFKHSVTDDGMNMGRSLSLLTQYRWIYVYNV